MSRNLITATISALKTNPRLESTATQITYDDGSPVSWELGYRDTVDWPRTVGEVFTTFQRTNFRVDQILEPTATGASLRGASYADLMRSVPATLLVRARKQGN